MKTNSVTLSSRNTGFSRFTNVGRLLLATACVSLVSVAAAPKALAAQPNGVYEFKSASGSVKFDGDSISIPEWVVKRLAGVVNGEITIENRTLRISRNATAKIVNELGDDFNVDVSTKVSGPTSVTFTKNDGVFKARTTSPVVASFEGDAFGEDFSGELVTDVSATVEGKTLRVVIKFSGDAFTSNFSGRLVVIAKR